MKQPTLKLREVTAKQADEFLAGKPLTEVFPDVIHVALEGDQVTHVCGDPDCIVPHPAPHKRPPTKKGSDGDTDN